MIKEYVNDTTSEKTVGESDHRDDRYKFKMKQIFLHRRQFKVVFTEGILIFIIVTRVSIKSTLSSKTSETQPVRVNRPGSVCSTMILCLAFLGKI